MLPTSIYSPTTQPCVPGRLLITTLSTAGAPRHPVESSPAAHPSRGKQQGARLRADSNQRGPGAWMSAPASEVPFVPSCPPTRPGQCQPEKNPRPCQNTRAGGTRYPSRLALGYTAIIQRPLWQNNVAENSEPSGRLLPKCNATLSQAKSEFSIGSIESAPQSSINRTCQPDKIWGSTFMQGSGADVRAREKSKFRLYQQIGTSLRCWQYSVAAESIFEMRLGNEIY